MDSLQPLNPGHRPAMVEHLTRLDPDDRIKRFCGLTTDEHIAAYAQRIAFGADVVLGALRGRHMVGLVHAAVFVQADGELAAEIGISVDSDARRNGLGKRMLLTAMNLAWARGIRHGQVFFLGSNVAMAALARSVGGRVQGNGHESSAWLDFSLAMRFSGESGAPAANVEKRHHGRHPTWPGGLLQFARP